MKLTPEIQEFLEKEGFTQLREVEGRGICGIMRFMFTIGLVYGLDTTGYRGRWCYDNVIEPTAALSIWDGKDDPIGNWIKYKGQDGERHRT